MGEYKEHLSSGGDLVVLENSWYISYYFSGPDLRYKGTFFKVNGIDIDKYIMAWKNNFKKYLELKSVIPSSSTYEVIGEVGMKISIGGYWDGVCIDRWHMRVNKKIEIDKIISDYEKCKDRAINIQSMLRSIK